jgi:hypothetical protein
MFCPPGLIFGRTEGVVSGFHVLAARNCFRRYRGRRVPFSCLALLDTFSVVRRASATVFIFCAPGLVFGGSEGVNSRFHVFLSPYSFSAVPRASGPDFMFCAPRFIFGGTEGVDSRSHLLRYRIHFRRFRWRRVLISCFASFASPYTFSAVPRPSAPVFMFCATRLVFDGTEDVRFRFHILRSRTRFQRYGWRWVPFSCFALPDSFSADLRSSGPDFMYCVPVLVFGDTEGDGSRFYVLRS